MVVNAAKIFDIERNLLALLHEDNQWFSCSLCHSDLIEHIGIVIGEDSNAEVLLQYRAEHLVRDPTWIAQVVGAIRKDVAFIDRRLDDEFEHVISMLTHVRPLGSDWANDEASPLICHLERLSCKNCRDHSLPFMRNSRVPRLKEWARWSAPDGLQVQAGATLPDRKSTRLNS